MNVQQNGLTRLAKSTSVYDKAFTEKLRKEGLSRLKNVEDLLIVNQAASPAEGMKAVEQLRDLRSAMMTIHQNVRQTSADNLEAANNRMGEIREEGGLKDAETRLMKFETDGYSPRRAVSKEVRFPAESAQLWTRDKAASGLSNIGLYLKDLTEFINIAAAATALPPGPMAVSVGSFAREGLTGTEADLSKQVTTDERVTTMADDLKLRLQHMKTEPPEDLSIGAERTGDIYYNCQEARYIRSGFLGLTRTPTTPHTWSERRRRYPDEVNELRTVEKHSHHPSHPWIPEDALSLYQ